MKNTNRFIEAAAFAFELHAKQKRKKTEIPYASHLMAVASLVMEDGGSEDEVIAALLHDAIEDQGPAYKPGKSAGLRKAIKARFGPAVLEIVEGCTDAETEPKPEWWDRKRKYIEHLKEASDSVRRVSCADKLHNARCILQDYHRHGEKLWDRFTAGKIGSLWYYRALTRVFMSRGRRPMTDELDAVVSELEWGVCRALPRRPASNYPRPDRPQPDSRQRLQSDESPVVGMSATAGVLLDRRPYTAQTWLQDGKVFLTVCFSTLGLRSARPEELLTLALPALESGGVPDEGRVLTRHDVRKTHDRKAHPLFSLTFLVGNATEGPAGRAVGNWLLDIGHVVERKCDPKRAIAAFKTAVESDPENPRAWYNLGDSLLSMKRHEQAVIALREADRLAPGTPLVRYDLGLALYGLGQYEEAARALEGVVESDPKLERAESHLGIAALTNIALCHGERGRWKDAIRTLQPATKTACDVLYNLGRFHIRAKEYEEAAKFLDAGAAIEPMREDVVHGVGTALMNLGKTERAEEYLARATRCWPPCADAWYDRGVNLAKTRDPKRRPKARECFERAIKINENHAWAHYDLACLDALSGNSEAAFSRLELAIQAGLSDRKHVENDRDLAILRRDPRWRAMTAGMGRRR